MGAINERIVQALEYANKSKAQFAKESGISPSAVTRLCNGINNPSAQTINDIARLCKVRVEWVKTGELPMEDNLTNGAILAKQIIESGVEFTAISKQAFIDRIDSLTDDEFIALANTVRKLFL